MQISEDRTQDEFSIGQVLGIAVAGSGGAAGLIVAIDRLRRRDQPRGRVDVIRDSVAHRVGGRLSDGMIEALPGRIRRTGGQAKRQAALVAAQAAELAAVAPREVKSQGSDARKVAEERLDRLRSDMVAKGEGLERSVGRQLHHARRRAKAYSATRLAPDVELLQQKGEELMNATQGTFRRARRRVSPLLESVRERAPQLGDQVADVASDRLHKFAEYSAGRAHMARETAAKVDVSAVQSAIEPAAGSLREASGRLKEDVAPAIRDAAIQAAAAAIGMWEAARTRAGHIDPDVVRAQAGESVSEVLDRARNAGSAAGDSMTSLVRDHAGDVKERASEARDRAGELSREALESTTRTTRDATSALVWAGIAGGLIYYGLLNQDQRQRVGSMVQSLYGGANELIRDIQGYDADFGDA